MLNHHAAAACSPTRAMLLSGTDAHLGGLGVLIEYKNSEKGAQRWSGKAGYEGYLTRDVVTVPEIFSDNGYHTVMSGKVRRGANRVMQPTPNPGLLRSLNSISSGILASVPPKGPGNVAFKRLSPCFLVAATTTDGSRSNRASPSVGALFTPRTGSKSRCESVNLSFR